jgi:capsular polysaccharide biosynthesis protein
MQKQLLLKSITIENKFPLNVSRDEEFYLKIRKQSLLDCFLFRLYNYNVLSDGTIFKNYIPLKESFVRTNDGIIKAHNWKGLLLLKLRNKTIKLSGNKVYLVAHNSYTGYFHWLGESMARLFLLKDELPSLTLLLPESFRDSFYSESLSLLGVKDIYYLKSNINYKVPNLLFASVTAQMGNFNPFIIRSISDFFISKTNGVKLKGCYDRIYVSRARAIRRKVLNEDEIVPFLESHSFKVICFEDLSFFEQIQMCRQVNILIGLHGAGLTNIMFMQPGSKVLELRKHDDGHNYFYYALSSALNLDYYYQGCISDKPELSVQDADIWVDMEELNRNIESMIKYKIA